MIQGVRQQNYIDTYDRNMKKTAKTSQEAPPFLLDYDEKGVVWDHAKSTEKQAEQKNTVQNKNSALKDTVELSIEQPQKKMETLKEQGEGNTRKLEIGAKISDFLKKIFSKVTEFFWYGNANSEEESGPKGKNLNADGTDENSAERNNLEENNLEQVNPDEELLKKQSKASVKSEKTKKENDISAEERIQLLIRNKDKAGLVDELTKHNTIALAKNSNLLTQYDRHGVIVEPDGGMRKQILEGDKSMRG